LKYQNYEQYLRHPMFRAARAAAMRRAGGRCEECRSAPATEVHHRDRKYPAWGAFDTSDHLEAVCHPCHCRLENKPE
jgi:hypothetical protein